MCMNYRQKQYSAFSNEISDSTKKLRMHLLLANERIQEQRYFFGYSFVAHGLAELQISNRSKNGSRAGRSRRCFWQSGCSSHSGLGKKSNDVLCGGGWVYVMTDHRRGLGIFCTSPGLAWLDVAVEAESNRVVGRGGWTMMVALLPVTGEVRYSEFVV